MSGKWNVPASHVGKATVPARETPPATGRRTLPWERVEPIRQLLAKARQHHPEATHTDLVDLTFHLMPPPGASLNEMMDIAEREFRLPERR
jgi:hypothetical protein